jgi:hypothetical protein
MDKFIKNKQFAGALVGSNTTELNWKVELDVCIVCSDHIFKIW